MRLGKIKGIEIKLHISTLVIVALVGFYAASFYNDLVENASIIDLITVGIINGIILLSSILLHELAHSITAQKYGLKVPEIELHLFGGVSKLEEEPQTPGSELWVSFVGPLTSLALGAGFLVGFFLFGNLPAIIAVTFLYSGISNIGLGIFNLLPAFPMDGGRVLRAYLWRKRHDLLSATKTASKVSTFFGYSLIAYGFIQMLLFGLLSGFWLVIIGMFLNSTSKQAYIQTIYTVQLANLSARDIIRTPKLAIPFDTTVLEAIRDYFMPYRYPYFPVIQGDRIVGIIHIDQINNIPFSERPVVIVGYVMKGITSFPIIQLDDTGKIILKKLNQMEEDPHIGVVMDDEREGDMDIVAGFIGEDDIMSVIKYSKLLRQQA